MKKRSKSVSSSPWHDLAARLIMQGGKEACSCYLMTSSGGDEGTSTVCEGVAAIAAKAGKKTAVLKIVSSGEAGAVSLAGLRDPVSCASNKSANFAKFTLPESFDTLPGFATSPKDWITDVELLLIDVPPVGTFMQQHFAPLCDGVVLVVDSRKRQLAEAARAVEMIGGQGGKLIGAVLNRHRSPIPRWFDRWGDCSPVFAVAKSVSTVKSRSANAKAESPAARKTIKIADLTSGSKKEKPKDEETFDVKNILS